MKKFSVKKIITLVLSLSLLVGAAFAIGAAADGETPSLRVARFNVEHGEKLIMEVAVEAIATEDVSLEIYTADGESLIHTVTESEERTIGDKSYLVFRTPAATPKEMYTEFCFKAVSADVNDCEMKKYSILEYFYEKIYFDTTTTDVQRTFLEYAKGYAEYAYRIFNEAEPTEYVYAYYDMSRDDIVLSDYLVALGEAVTPTSDNVSIESFDVINEKGETVATVAKGEAFTATEAGSYKFVPERKKVLLTFDNLTASSSFGNSKYTNTKGLVTDADSDGNNEGYIFNQNKTNTDCWFAPGAVTTDKTGNKYEFEMKFKLDTITGNLAFYDYDSSQALGSEGTSYAFILIIASDGTVTLQSMSQKVVVEGKTLTADKTWHTISIVGDIEKGGTLTLTVDGEEWASVTTDTAMVGDSFEILLPKSTSNANTKFYVDDCGVNYYYE